MVRVLIIDSTNESNLENKIVDEPYTLSFDVVLETEALEVMAQHAFDLIIYRVAMPAMKANLDIKERYPQTPLFVVPAFSYEEQGKEVEECHIVQDIIPKFIQKQLHQTLSHQ